MSIFIYVYSKYSLLKMIGMAGNLDLEMGIPPENEREFSLEVLAEKIPFWLKIEYFTICLQPVFSFENDRGHREWDQNLG